jgi:hypothetical protein
MIQSTFRDWTFDTIDAAFGTEQIDSLPSLEHLLHFPYAPTEFEEYFLHSIQDEYKLGGDDWNEVELENRIISPIIVCAKISNKKFSYFLERPLVATIGNYEISGRVDGMIATGTRNPRKPFFCLAEYKRQTAPESDPKGQVLSSMLAAQTLNIESTHPVFGCYIVGSTWYFMALEGRQYAVSNGFFCTDDGIFGIFRVLKGLRYAIEQFLNLAA